MILNKPLILVFVAMLFNCLMGFNAVAKDIILGKQVVIYTDAPADSPISIAITALKRDLGTVLGANVLIKPTAQVAGPGIIVFTSQSSGALPATITGWEASHVYVRSPSHGQHIVLEGSDIRGTIYAIYTFSEKILGVPPLWYFCSWKPTVQKQIAVSDQLDILTKSPTVKYRAWFPNDTDLFEPWRQKSEANYKTWLETMMRLKLNTVEWFDDERDYNEPYSVSKTTKLIQAYGLVNTTHHHSPLNASFAGWKDYWEKVRHMAPPKLLLANLDKLEEFWRYNVESIVRNKIDMLWVLGFRGSGDHPFWYTFTDAPESATERGKVISDMLERQRQIVLSVTKNPDTQFRTIFYDELSDLLARNLIKPPADSTFIWTYVATRRDHYPNLDLQQLDKSRNLRLGYYFNYQFTSTGSHLAAAEGPWKMEQNFRYVASKTNQPIAFAVVNAGNLREHLMELSAHAEMMWDFNRFDTDTFLNGFCAMYFGKHKASSVATLYKAFYASYWNQRKPVLEGFDRQFVFQDLRYNRALKELATAFGAPYTSSPLTDIPAEQEKNRTYNIVPQDNGCETVIEALIKETKRSATRFGEVARKAQIVKKSVSAGQRTFLDDNLIAQARYMEHLNLALFNLSMGYSKQPDNNAQRLLFVKKAIDELQQARAALGSTQHGIFVNWYAGDRVFGFNNVLEKLQNLLK